MADKKNVKGIQLFRTFTLFAMIVVLATKIYFERLLKYNNKLSQILFLYKTTHLKYKFSKSVH